MGRSIGLRMSDETFKQLEAITKIDYSKTIRNLIKKQYEKENMTMGTNEAYNEALLLIGEISEGAEGKLGDILTKAYNYVLDLRDNEELEED